MTYCEVLPFDVGPGDPRWADVHQLGVSATDVAKVLGLSRWGNAYTVYVAKTTEPEPSEMSEPARWGTLLEPVIADRFAERHPEVSLRRCGVLANVENGWMLATPDRIADDCLLEVKTAGLRSAGEWGEPGTDEIPHAYLLQTQWQLAVTGLGVCHVAVLIAGQDYREYTVIADPDVHAYLIGEMWEFWQRVIDRNPPEADDSETTTQALAKAHPAPVLDSVEHEDARALADEYQNAVADESAAAKRKAAAGNKLRQLIGDHEAVTCGGLVAATWKAQTRESLDTAALLADHPEFADKYRRTNTFRVLRAVR